MGRDDKLKQASSALLERVLLSKEIQGRLQDTVAKVLVTDWVEDELPKLRWVNHEILDQVCRIHADDCQAFSAEVPLIIAIGSNEVAKAVNHLNSVSYHGLNTSQLFWLIDEMSLPGRIDEGKNNQSKFVPNINSTYGFYRKGAAFTLADLINKPLMANLWNQGIRWLLIGEVWNLGCRLDLDLLERLRGRRDDGFMECRTREAIPNSKILMVPSPQDPNRYLPCHEKRLRTEHVSPVAAQARWAGVGTYWVSCKSFVKALNCQPDQILTRWNEEAAGQSRDFIAKNLGMLSHHGDEILLTYPLCDLVSRLSLEAVQVPESRFQPLQSHKKKAVHVKSHTEGKMQNQTGAWWKFWKRS